MYQGELNERRYLLAHRPASGPRRAILWSVSTPRPVPVVFGLWQELAPGVMRAEYDADELARACAVWAESGVRCDAAAIVREVFGDTHAPPH